MYLVVFMSLTGLKMNLNCNSTCSLQDELGSVGCVYSTESAPSDTQQQKITYIHIYSTHGEKWSHTTEGKLVSSLGNTHANTHSHYKKRCKITLQCVPLVTRWHLSHIPMTSWIQMMVNSNLDNTVSSLPCCLSTSAIHYRCGFQPWTLWPTIYDIPRKYSADLY